MAKTKISEFSATPANNTDIDSINIAEGCAPSGINDAIRELMAQLKDWQAGTSNDPMVIGTTGSLTLNQGTANGVTYLNGSKVLTSGSGLVFDGTNLGVGVTPSAWGTYKAFQISSGYAVMAVTGNDYWSMSNAFYDGSGFKYIANGFATAYETSSGKHSWRIAASGTAGNAITFTQAMTLAADGNLLLGTTTSPSYSGYTTLALNSATNGGLLDIQLAGSRIGSLQAGSSTELRLFANTSVVTTLYGGGSERARIDSSGEFLIGTTSSGASQRLAIVGGATLCMMKNTSATDGTQRTTILFRDNGDNSVGTLKTSTAGINLTGVTGITFPATQSASSDANTLDDYEEGSFTPTVTFASGSGATFNNRSAQYTKIGRIVFVQYNVHFSGLGTSSGILTLGGLPFATVSDSYMGRFTGAAFLDRMTNGFPFGVGQNATTFAIQSIPNGSGSSSELTAANLNATSYLTVNFYYIIS